MVFKLSETLKPELALAAPDFHAQVRQAGDIVKHLENTRKRYLGKPVHEAFAGLACILEKCDSSDAPVGSAFMRGNVLGLSILETAMGENIVDDLVDTNWFSHDKDLPKIAAEDAAESIRALLLGLGHAGFLLVEPSFPALHDWDLEVTQDASTTGVFRDAVGFPIYHAQRMIEQKPSDGLFEAILQRSGIFADWNPDIQS